MKRLWFDRKEVKRGVASLYVVLFATILFGVVTLSFMRIILSEAGQSSDDDLSQSAYDSAMAGVEDAKRAVNRYYDCLGRGGTAASCNASALFATNCENGIGLAKYLYGENYGSNDTGWEVKIQETEVGSGNPDNESDQAYTCVVISDTVPDYRGTLTADTRTRVIPLAVFDGGNNTHLSEAKKVRFQWFSRLNIGDKTNFILSNGKKLSPYSSKTTPPTIQLSLIHFQNEALSTNFNTANNNDNYQYSTVVLLPSLQSDSDVITTISWDTIKQAGDVNKTSPDRNEPIEVACSNNTEFACTVELEIAGFSNRDNLFLVASEPYGDAFTDFAASMYRSDGSVIQLVGSQISVDSTGRTNQLVRRVETRLDPADLYFPYPQFALDMDGDGDVLKKIFWITANCWYSSKSGGIYTSGACANNGEST